MKEDLNYLRIMSEELTEKRAKLKPLFTNFESIRVSCLEGTVDMIRNIHTDESKVSVKTGAFRKLTEESIVILVQLILENSQTTIEDTRDWETKEVKELNSRIQKRLEE